MQTRIQIIGLGFLLVFLAIGVRLFYWQIIRGKELSSQAKVQYESGETILAPRGNILASDSTWLVASGEAWLLFAYLPDIDDPPKEIADKLAPFFVVREDEESDSEYREKLLNEVDRLYSLLKKDEVVWVALKRKLLPETKKNIEALSISGIGFEPTEKRVYPEASSAAHLLGFVGKNKEGEDTGYFGLEGFYDLSLSGKPGFLKRESDAKGTPILFGGSYEISAVGGTDLKTYIDKSIQLTIEEQLVDAIEKYGAKEGSVVLMNPKNGAILGMASYPSYDPEQYSEYGDEYFKNPVVSSSFEPGSIFKVLVMSAALDADVVEPDTRCEICNGPLRVDKYIIRTWNNEYHPDSTILDVIVNSDNVGMAYVGQTLGADKLYDYLDNFGIGKLTGVDLQGEATPRLRPKDKWSIVDVSTASFGQGIAVTPIQMIKAVSAIANKGVLVTPQVVDSLQGRGWAEDIKPEFGERVISEETAKVMTSMMVEAAKNGEAKWTHLRGFKVAGKTGTAQIPVAGNYDSEKTIASFIGFAPADDPEFLMLVTLRESESSPWASETAAPLWYSIANELFLYFGIQPEN